MGAMAGAGKGVVYLVGAGPGDPDLITVKGRRLIEGCDALVHDFLVAEEMKGWVKGGCEVYDVGKRSGRHTLEQGRICELLVELAGRGLRVVRLKGGDPFVFGRGGEEAEALRRAGIGYEVVPAVTAALGCAAYSGIPLTHRDWSSAVTILSGHPCTENEADRIDWEVHARGGATLVLYMAMGRLEGICGQLIEGGRAAGTPAAVIEWGTTARQKSVRGTLGDIAPRVAEAGLGAPAVVIIGEVAALGDELQWFDPGI
jgi:uroporphyrinogen III methyltransferase / synthase